MFPQTVCVYISTNIQRRISLENIRQRILIQSTSFTGNSLQASVDAAAGETRLGDIFDVSRELQTK